MKGVVFVELLAMADATAGEDAVDQVVSRCPLASKGAYTRVGTYPSSELHQLVSGLSSATGASVDLLQRQFGRWMLARYFETYPGFFNSQPDAFTMLESIEHEVHAEVRKLYPDAELPTFETERLDDSTLRMTYRSPRRLVAFCQGLIEACIDHFNETASVACIDRSTAQMGIVDFTITRIAQAAE